MSGTIKFLQCPELTVVSSSASVGLTLVSRNGQGQAGQPGVVHVEEDSMQALFAWTAANQLVNEARITGQATSQGLQLTAVHRTGSSANSVAGAAVSCTSSNLDVVQVSNDCSSVSISGQESGTSFFANVTVSAGSLSATLPFQVWQPQAPLNIDLADSEVCKECRAEIVSTPPHNQILSPPFFAPSSAHSARPGDKLARQCQLQQKAIPADTGLCERCLPARR